MAMTQRVRQSICPVCGLTVRPGKGAVLEFGAGGRVHALRCLAIAQQVTLARRIDEVPTHSTVQI